MSSKRKKVLSFPESSVAKAPITASSIDVSASSESRVAALDEEQLREVLPRIVYYGEIKEAFHSSRERAYRNISQEDILAMLEGEWKLAARPDWDEAHKNWEYKLTGHDLEGDGLVLKIAVNEELQRVTIITKF